MRASFGNERKRKQEQKRRKRREEEKLEREEEEQYQEDLRKFNLMTPEEQKAWNDAVIKEEEEYNQKVREREEKEWKKEEKKGEKLKQYIRNDIYDKFARKQLSAFDEEQVIKYFNDKWTYWKIHDKYLPRIKKISDFEKLDIVVNKIKEFREQNKGFLGKMKNKVFGEKLTIGGTGGKKVRKHRGVTQTGGNAGRLRKGYRYSGKKLKSGLPQIVKAKSKKN